MQHVLYSLKASQDAPHEVGWGNEGILVECEWQKYKTNKLCLFYIENVFGTPKRFYTEPFLWVQ